MKRIVVVLGVVLALCSGCGGGGACVVPSVTGNPGWSACHDNWDASDCSSRSGAFSAGKTCSALGYTRSCPADGSNSYRLASYSC